MTRRLTIVFVSIVLATLLLAGFATLVVGNVRARSITETDLRRQAQDISTNIAAVVEDGPNGQASGEAQTRRRTAAVLTTFRKVFQLQDLTIVTIRPEGTVVGDPLPTVFVAHPKLIVELTQMQVISGNQGNLVYAAAPARLANGSLIVVAITRQANSGLVASLRTFALAALATLLIGALAAMVLGRRLTLPLRQASLAAEAIAAGDLSTRLPDPGVNQGDEVAALTRAINAMAANLDRSRSVEQQFLLSVSHDLRTPLTSIRGYADAIKDQAVDPNVAAKVIHSESQRLERLVADLLDLAKLRSHQFSMHIRQVDLVATAQASIDGFATDASDRGVTVAPALAGRMMVLGDPDRLAQVFANLLENALKYASSHISIEAAAAGRWAIVAVHDDGPGIAAADLAHVFERLYVSRSEPARRENSSGLGLAIVKELVEAMNGQVTVQASVLGGACFVVQLPLVDGA
jgi:signal transduction histidine kinase